MPQPSYAHGPCDVALLGETIGASLRRTVERCDEREALVVRHQDFRATYRELWAMVERAARGLLARGVQMGERVGIWSPNRWEWVVTQYATARIGAILVNINPAYKAAELEYVLRQCGVSVLILVLGNLAAAVHGACIVVPSESFDALAVLEAVQAERCTSLYGVPTMFIAELEQPRFGDFDLSCLRTGMMGGAPCPVEVMRQVRARLHMEEVTIVYGMTETSPVSVQTSPDDPLEKRVETVGRVQAHVEVKVVDPASGAVVPRGVRGELCARGYLVMLGYWENPEATRAAIDAGRWMHTGDLALMDEAGYLRIVGRLKDMIIRGGENISPREVEEFLYTHPGVSDAQVIGVPDPKYGEEVMAWVRVKDGARLSGDELALHCRGRIASFKIPRYWKFVDAFPMTVTGKIQKFRMREIAAAELGLDGPGSLRS